MTLWSAALLVSSGAAHAYTVRECVEKWYPQAKVGQQIYELHPVKTVDCQKHDIEMKSSRFGTIDGKGYFITDSESTTYACPRVGSGVGIPIFACMLPAALQRNVVYETREYYLLTPHGADLRPLGKSLYSTDGRTVFRFTTPINDADPATFQLLDSDGADHNPDWARDSTHIYYRDTSVPDMVPDEVRFAGPFVLNDGRVFEVDLNRVHTRPDVRPTLTLLAAQAPYYGSLVSDGQRIYLDGKALDGVHADNFHLLSPSCPVPGHPDLHCVEGIPLASESSKEFRLARAGNDVLYFRSITEVNKVVRIADVPDFVYFQPAAAGLVLGISGQRLFYLSSYGTPPEKGFAFMGRISGPIAGELIDESGFITSFPWSDLKSCSEESAIPPWPKSDDLARLGSLRLLPDAEVPEGFAVALENERYRYLFVSRDKQNTRDTVIDLHDGRRMQADCK